MAEQTRTPEIVLLGNEEGPDLTLLDLIDHVLNTGVIIRGNLVLSLAGVDLVYLGLTAASLPFTLLEAACRAGSTVMVEAKKR